MSKGTFVQSRLQRAVDAVHATGATGVLARVSTAGGSTAARAGVADLGSGRPVPWGAYHRIGSITKTFTATVALQLVGEGEFGLDDTVEERLPGVVRGNGNDGRKITVRDLLRQTSGLNDYDEHLPWVRRFTPAKFREERFRAYRPEELIALAMKNPPQWVPDPGDPAAGTRWGYSNTNYLLVDMIIEKVTGNSTAQEINDRVIEPLGLHHTLLAGTSPHVPRPRATGYTRFPGHEELTDTSVFTPFPDAPLISTTSDVTSFFRALMSGRLLRPAQLTQMKDTVEARDKWTTEPGARYGLGVYWRPAEGCAEGIWYHGGTMPGYISQAGVTADGSRAAATSATTWRPGDQQGQDAQDRATVKLIDRALCRIG
ncbi:serine hydrolase domain-containing protein [Actinomadura sp. LOL_016]|uniref:serine hydrolase domain-containing protein n=1 Tax=unclassified Actinomadura TaxID=2626254 RepID=UPI003A7F7255